MSKQVKGMTEVVSNRDYTLATLLGHTIFFKAGKKTMCPDMVLEEAIAVGIIPTDNSDLPGPPGLDGPLPAEVTGSARVAQIRDIIEALVERNGRGDFTASGIPSKKVIEHALGYRIDDSELGKVWHTIQLEKADTRRLDQDNLVQGLDQGPERPEDSLELAVALEAAIQSIVESASPEDYTAAGVPLARAIENRLGYDVSEDERDEAWEAHKAAQKPVTVKSKPKGKAK